MKYKVFSLLLASLFLISCSNSETSSTTSTSSSTSSPSLDDETYTIEFVANGEVVKKVENAKYGDYIDIPEVSSPLPRHILAGWDGISKAEQEAGKVMVYQTDATYIASFKERFGTENVFDIPRIKSTESIAVDGTKDSAYNDVTPIQINDLSEGETNVSANAYFLWDESNLYALFEVEDSSIADYSSSIKKLNNVDSLELFLDLLHDDYLAIDGYTEGWGQKYRGEPGPMCEGQFAIARGVAFPKNNKRCGGGSEFRFEGWLSFAANESGTTLATTKQTLNGYNVEYRIDCTNQYVPVELRPHLDQEIGIGINIFDNEVASSLNGVISLEEINRSMEISPKRLSRFHLVSNPDEPEIIFTAKEVRDNFDVNDEFTYKEAYSQAIGKNEVKLLWNEDGIHLFAKLDNSTNEIAIKDKDISINNNGHYLIPKDDINVNDYVSLTFINKTTSSTEEIETLIHCVPNAGNLEPARKMFKANKANGSILVDGIIDDEYLDSPEIDVNVVSLTESSAPKAHGKAYVKWDDSYLYVFVDVSDSDVNKSISSAPHENDSVELWISTCQNFPTDTTPWGEGGRPANYCGEGLFRAAAGNVSELTGFHWMFDKVEREVTSVITSYGYTVEYKIGFGSFSEVKNKENQIIELTLDINDRGISNRKGIVSTNMYGHRCFEKPYYLDHIKLVNE